LAAPDAQEYIRSSQKVLRQLILPFQTGLKSTWTLPQLRTALRGQRIGELDLSSQLYDTLLEDDEIHGSLKKRVNATLKAPFKLINGDDPDQPLTKREKKIQRWFCKMAPKSALRDAIADFLIMGAAVGTIDWNFSGPDGTWFPTLRMLPTEFLRYDDERRAWFYQGRTDIGEQEVTPGDGKWFLLTGERGWRWGLVRALALTWLGKQLMYLDWQRYSQKHGSPIFKAKIPIWRDDQEKRQFAADLATVMAEGVIGLPQDETSQGQLAGYDVELLEATTISWQGFQAGLERADRKFQVMLIGGNLGAEATSKGSNRAAAETHSAALAELAAGDAEELAQALQYQLLRPFMLLNYGTDAVPLPFWDADPDDDARAWVPAQGQFMVALAGLAKGGVKVKNLAEVGRKLGLELEYSSEGVVDKIANPPKPDPASKPGASKSAKPAAGKK
jgi:phage gp29-like protein